MSGSFLRNKRGFSLVELMVVVAIIGILASIAIPSIGRYMAKARQSEAKTNLSSLYTAEKAFFAEYNAYTGGFLIIGFAPEGRLRYNVGFAAEGVTCATLQGSYGYSSAVCPVVYTSVNAYCAANPTLCTQLADGLGANGTLTGAVNPTATTFVAAAAGRIKNAAGAVSDIWTISEVKFLRNTADGTQ